MQQALKEQQPHEPRPWATGQRQAQAYFPAVLNMRKVIERRGQMRTTDRCLHT